MIPFFKATPIHLFGPLSLQPFGLLVGTGVLSGAWLCMRRAREAKIPEQEIRDVIFWSVVPGFWVAHWVTVLFYHSEWLDTRGPFILLKFWDGLSSFGGFLGALLGLLFYFRGKQRPWLVQAEIIVQGLVLGWIFGRLGCTLAHDHPGNHTDFFFAVNYPDGPRFDLGLYEFLYTLFILFPVSLWIHAKKYATGTLIAAMLVLYAPMRFTFDFLRVDDRADADARYLGLTPAQYGCIGVLVFALWLIHRLRARGLRPRSLVTH